MLEQLVRKLGGDPENHVQSTGRSRLGLSTTKSPSEPERGQPADTNSVKGRSGDPVMLEEDGQPLYLESRAWQGWMGCDRDQDVGISHEITTKSPFPSLHHPHALQGIICGQPSIVLDMRYPSPQDAMTLWATFKERVRPFVGISFDWALELLLSRSTRHERAEKGLTTAEHAFIFSLYLISVISLSDQECRDKLRQPRYTLISEYQMLCEEALSRTNLLCITEITALKALAVYMMAGADRLSTHSLWSLMGVVIRSAEKLGIHRDGAILGLPPFETEERRRLWWQLQHLDLFLAVRSGLTSMTLTADWDSRMPLNIEDDDIDTSMTTFPEERKGLTNISYCRFTYWAIDQQRRFFNTDKGRFELSWQTNNSISQAVKGSFIDHLEESLNQNFLQYCDPIKPMDILIQFSARGLICGMHERALHPQAKGKGLRDASNEHRIALVAACTKSLQYNIAINSHPSIRHFNWWTKSFFPWHAFMCVLVEVSQQTDSAKLQRMWDLLGELYSTNSFLSDLSEDRRRSHAANLVIAAWKGQENKLSANLCPPKPDFVTNLETLLSHSGTGVAHMSSVAEAPPNSVGSGIDSATLESLLAEQSKQFTFDLDFQDIDWSFWSSID